MASKFCSLVDMRPAYGSADWKNYVPHGQLLVLGMPKTVHSLKLGIYELIIFLKAFMPLKLNAVTFL